MSANGGEASNIILNEGSSRNRVSKKIGIVGLWYQKDFDAILSDYALYKALENLGHDPVMLNKPLDLWPEQDMSSPSMENHFIHRNCTVYPICRTKEDYFELNKRCDAFLVGSGTVWNYEACGQSGEYFYLDFVSNSKGKIAYGSSFGDEFKAPKAECERAEKYLKQFDAVSVHDDSDIVLCKQFHIQAQKALEPLLLCDTGTFMSSIAKEKSFEGNPFLVFSGSEIGLDQWGFLQRTAKMLRLDILNLEKTEISDNQVKPDSKINTTKTGTEQAKKTVVLKLKSATVQGKESDAMKPKLATVQQLDDYLSILYNSGFVVASNFTMTTLAILLHKSFVVLIHKYHPDYLRIVSLLKLLGLTDRLLYLGEIPEQYDYLFTDCIDYEYADKQLNALREKSLEWLQLALSTEKMETFEEKPEFIQNIPQHFKPRDIQKPVSFKLQNLILPDKSYLNKHWWMLYRGDRLIRRDGLGCYALPEGGTVEFFTYFNAFSVQKWKKYTGLENVYLHLRARGRFTIRFFGHYFKDGVIKKESFQENSFQLKEIQEIALRLPTSACVVMGFEICAHEDFELYSGHYSVSVFLDQLNPVELTIATTTFQKEEFITSNMALMKQDLLETNEEIASHLMIEIIDNGRTLEPEKYNCERMHVYPNPNVGGSGGFTRGIMEALNASVKPTHVLLMDDDVIILPESIKRTYNLLRLLKEEYQSDFVSGAMLYYEQMNVQHEDVGFVSKDNGGYGPRKPTLEMHTPEAVLRNEEDFDGHDYQYAGWWYCCIPTRVIETIGLPLPMFIRGDDVEYSLRNQANFITMNGICIWHMGFVTKYNAAMELYQVHRNSLIVQAISGICEKVDFMERIKGFFWKEIRRYNYNSAELLLDAIEDYLMGPKLLLEPNGEQIIKAHLKKNEPLVSISQYPGHDTSHEAVYSDKPLTAWQEFFYRVTFNGHLCPKFLLNKTPAVIAYDWFESPGNQYMHEFLLAVNVHAKTANMRYVSRKKFVKLVLRYNKLIKRYRRENEQVKKDYADSMKQFTSQEFWKGYLGIKEDVRNEAD